MFLDNRYKRIYDILCGPPGAEPVKEPTPHG